MNLLVLSMEPLAYKTYVLDFLASSAQPPASEMYFLNEYTTQVTLLPELPNSGNKASALLNQFEQFGSMLNMDVNSLNNSNDALRTDLYPEIVKSVPFLYRLLYIHVFDSQSVENSKTLLAIIANVDTINQGDITTPTQNLNFNNILDDHIPIIHLSEIEYDAIRHLRKKISSFSQPKTGLFVISVKMPDPVLSAQVADSSIHLLKTYISNYKIQKAKQNLQFIEQQKNEAEMNFYTAQNKLSEFRDNNLNVISNRYKSEEERLNSDYTLKFGLYNSLLQQYEQAKINLQQVIPVFRVLEPPRISKNPSSPEVSVILIFHFLIGIILGVISAFLKPKFIEISGLFKNGKSKL